MEWQLRAYNVNIERFSMNIEYIYNLLELSNFLSLFTDISSNFIIIVVVKPKKNAMYQKKVEDPLTINPLCHSFICFRVKWVLCSRYSMSFLDNLVDLLPMVAENQSQIRDCQNTGARERLSRLYPEWKPEWIYDPRGDPLNPRRLDPG